jgi:hypothetical protein
VVKGRFTRLLRQSRARVANETAWRRGLPTPPPSSYSFLIKSLAARFLDTHTELPHSHKNILPALPLTLPGSSRTTRNRPDAHNNTAPSAAHKPLPRRSRNPPDVLSPPVRRPPTASRLKVSCTTPRFKPLHLFEALFEAERSLCRGSSLPRANTVATSFGLALTSPPSLHFQRSRRSISSSVLSRSD